MKYSFTIEAKKEIQNPNIEYKKTLADEIDWKIIDQLHAATINFSTACIRMKRLFVIMLGFGASVLKYLDTSYYTLSLLIMAIILTSLFWILDSIYYYYQE